jgi:hypothetical protein
VSEVVIAVDAKYFYAGVVAVDGKVAQVAPILRRHIKVGWSGRQVADYVSAKGWRWERCPTATPADLPPSPAPSEQP